MSLSNTNRKPSTGRRVATLVAAGAVILSALVGCAAGSAEPILPGTPVIKLLPTKAALDKLFGSQWEEATAPRQLDPSEMIITKKPDPAVLGAKCAKAGNDFDASFTPKDGATVGYGDKQSNNAGLALYRLATVAKADAIVQKFGAVGEACKNSPGTDIQPLKSSIPGAVVYGSADGTTGKPYRFMAIADGDLVIMASDISTARAEKEIQFELDTIAKLAKAG